MNLGPYKKNPNQMNHINHNLNLKNGPMNSNSMPGTSMKPKSDKPDDLDKPKRK